MTYILLYLEVRLRLWLRAWFYTPRHCIPQGRGAHRYTRGDEPKFNPMTDTGYHTRPALAGSEA